ncbi:ArgP/LysG family DNA-binding transcriptional regulator [Pacificitalea manganoxidans]|uniref:ArgP/LysG family DNA-binding transcriptional regulator n=1 Tax=Pacificitalea manganoxidans TaxID=1411902 RepID=A0A291M148_9RHOB|nr:LysR family transcriptional regulator ArgP [Pacificitalea manganoxidans]ATI42686.1 ArgP/LysG family DNA-binding transcriptional regulator [Pacificitalea manganoxidans]MDR6307430.1 LysR family transcriptional regulator (chromosome initiation inhibitor) [Pacificitalea manganoxidans]
MLDYPALLALAAVVETGSFDRAAARLAVTPSAISQRIRQLEERTGTALVVRGQPARATAVGARLVRHVGETRLMEARLAQDIAADLPAPLMVDGPRPVRVAVNADSLATWFIEAMRSAPEFLFDLVIDDQDHSADWLRRGEVSAAVSAHDGVIPGCDRIDLGVMRYRIVTAPSFLERWCPDGVTAEALSQAPALTYDLKDGLQRRWSRAVFGHEIVMPTHWLPSSHGFAEAARAGLGYGANPELLIREDLATGRLVELIPDTPLDVPLAWQVGRLIAPALAPLTASVRKAWRAAAGQA